VSFVLRPARPGDLALLPAIEMTGDRLFATVGIVFPPGRSTVEEAIEEGAEVLVAGDPPVGFAAVLQLDGHAHLEQISVHADFAGRGVGTRLLAEVVRRAATPVTLLTFRDVPWNGPFYARHGFAELPRDQWGPQLQAQWQVEIDAGLHEAGPRLVMRSTS
jgi:GNAT superfamily N-acetyltransferase